MRNCLPSYGWESGLDGPAVKTLLLWTPICLLSWNPYWIHPRHLIRVNTIYSPAQ